MGYNKNNTARPSAPTQLRLSGVRVGFLFMASPIMSPYTKPYLSLPDQLRLIKSRGLQVADDVEAVDCLHRNGYYRLSA